MTPDGREVDFRCHHNHRTQSAAVDCADTIRKQMERGQSLHLVTRVRSTPASREAARQRELRKEADRQAKAAQAAQHRAEQQQTRRQAKAVRRAGAARQSTQQKETCGLQRQQDSAEQHARQAQAAQQWAEIRQRNDERWDRVHRQRAERARRRRPHGWPVPGLVIAGAVVLLGVILAGVAGNNPHSALATTVGALITLGILAMLICGTAALWRGFRKGKRNQPYHPIADSQNNSAVPYLAHPFTNTTDFNPDAYPGHTAAGYLPHPGRDVPHNRSFGM